jgi:hypothetical protein
MITQDKLHQMVNSVVAEALASKGGPQPTIDPPTAPVPSNASALNEVEGPGTTEHEFDEMDSLKCAVYLLRVRNERLVQEIEDRRRSAQALDLDLASKAIHDELAQKYGIDLETNELSIDPQEKSFTVTPK